MEIAEGSPLGIFSKHAPHELYNLVRIVTVLMERVGALKTGKNAELLLVRYVGQASEGVE